MNLPGLTPRGIFLNRLPLRFRRPPAGCGGKIFIPRAYARGIKICLIKMKRFIVILVLAGILGMIGLAEAKSGCCSHHKGVCTCRCCDGTSLSATCAPYYPACTPAPVAKPARSKNPAQPSSPPSPKPKPTPPPNSQPTKNPPTTSAKPSCHQ